MNNQNKEVKTMQNNNIIFGDISIIDYVCTID